MFSNEEREGKQLRDIDNFFLGKDSSKEVEKSSSEEEDNDASDEVDDIRVNFPGARDLPQLAFAAQSLERSAKQFNR